MLREDDLAELNQNSEVTRLSRNGAISINFRSSTKPELFFLLRDESNDSSSGEFESSVTPMYRTTCDEVIFMPALLLPIFQVVFYHYQHKVHRLGDSGAEFARK